MENVTLNLKQVLLFHNNLEVMGLMLDAVVLYTSLYTINRVNLPV